MRARGGVALASSLSLFDTAPYNYSEGSKAGAAAVVASGAAGVQLRRVLEVVERSGAEGTTRKDIAVALGLPESTVAARVYTLKSRGQVSEITGAGRRFPKAPGSNVRQGVLVAGRSSEATVATVAS